MNEFDSNSKSVTNSPFFVYNFYSHLIVFLNPHQRQNSQLAIVRFDRWVGIYLIAHKYKSIYLKHNTFLIIFIFSCFSYLNSIILGYEKE